MAVTTLSRSGGTIHRSEAVPSTYTAAMIGALTNTERGSVRRGSFTSPPSVAESSSPA